MTSKYLLRFGVLGIFWYFGDPNTYVLSRWQWMSRARNIDIGESYITNQDFTCRKRESFPQNEGILRDDETHYILYYKYYITLKEEDEENII